MGPNARIKATSPAAVAAAFSNNCRPTSPGDNVWAAIPEPTTTATRNAVPQNSARARRHSAGRITSTLPRLAEEFATKGAPPGGRPLRSSSTEPLARSNREVRQLRDGVLAEALRQLGEVGIGRQVLAVGQ